jgi:hypothetical protein
MSRFAGGLRISHEKEFRCMLNLIRAVSVASAVGLLGLLPMAAGAQTVAPPLDEPGRTAVTPSALTAVRLDARVLTFPQNLATRQQPRRDSLWNGALVGVGLGAMTGSVIGLVAFDESDSLGFNAPLTFGVLGAGVGAVIGAGVDALRHDRSTTTGLPDRTPRVNLSPLLGRNVRGMLAWIRF